MKNLRYSPEEILQILNDCYNFQAAFDPEVEVGAQLTFDTTICDWRDICDLLPAEKLAKVEHTIWELNTPVEDLEQVISHCNNTLATFCNYIAKHALKQEITPIKLLGQTCISAAIYRSLINNLASTGVDTRNIRPNSDIKLLLDKAGGTLVIEANKLAPGSFSKFENEENWISKLGIGLFFMSIFSTILFSAKWHFQWILLIPLSLSISIMMLGRKFKPKRSVIGGYDTVRDLIMGMQLQIEKTIIEQ